LAEEKKDRVGGHKKQYEAFLIPGKPQRLDQYRF